jgi:predicted nucleotidyltransferase
MAGRKVKAAIEFLERCLRESGVTPSKIILFGSQAKGKATKESDIDVVIISENFRNKDILERAAMTKDAEIRTLRKFMIPLDIVTLTPEENNTSLIAAYAKDADAISVK